jgi:transcriptional regulator with XRE-family HTH domain
LQHNILKLKSIIGGIDLKNEIDDLVGLDMKIKDNFEKIKNHPNGEIINISFVDNVKHSIREKTCKIFVYNLNKLIQLESTQKNLSKKIGVSEDVLSKYKTGTSFPNIETLIYICEIYNIDLAKFLSTRLTSLDIGNIENNEIAPCTIFEENYYVYFLVTNLTKKGTIQVGTIKISNNNVVFNIHSNNIVIKQFRGDYSISDKLVSFNLHSAEDGTAYISMIKPNINKSRYVGGLSMLSLATDANSKPCCQKILFSKTQIDRTANYTNLKELLSFCVEETSFDNIKISQAEDELAYNFIQSKGTQS